MKAHTYLRDRNAHPDWLFSQGGSLSEAEQVQSLDNMLLLSRFYGYMILALAGFKNLEPIFPPPHKTSGAAATVTRVEENSPNVFPNLFQWKQQVDPIERLPEQLSKAQTYHEKTMLRRNFDRKRGTQLQQESEQSIDDEFEIVADQLADEFAACVGANAPVLSDYAVSRASIYEDHP
jgi:antitoxin ParD1/3/4